MTELSFGVKTYPMHTTYEDMLKIWMAADSIPEFEHAWAFDHFAPIHSDLDGPCLEGWTLLAAFAALTSRVRVGLMVTGNTYRHPAVLAHMAATVDVISQGRLDLGIGTGWSEYEHESMGIPLYPPGQRVRRLDEACEIIKRLHTQHLTDFEGRYYQLKQARCEPKPVQKPHPPLVIGGLGEKLTLRVVAKHADVWNFSAGSADLFRHKVSVLHQHCAEVGRDPAEITLSAQCPVSYDDLKKTAQTAQDLVEAGARHLVLTLHAPFPDGIVPRLAEQVIGKVRA